MSMSSIEEGLYGLVFNIQRFSIHDGPGIRTTVFLKGCMLKCFWCHNPESINPFPELQYFPQKCMSCMKCASICTENAHRNVNEKKEFIRSLCKNCGKCIEACNAGALEMAGKRMSVMEVIDEVEKDEVFYKNSGGGVTFSGGEPLMQRDFIKALLMACKKHGLHTAIETAGNVPWKTFEEIIPYVDLFLYDIKVADENKHKEVTGSSNRLCQENLKKLIDLGATINIRIPVIPGVNDTEEEMERIFKLINATGRNLPVKLLPFHRLGESKYVSLGIAYKAQGFEVPTEEKMKTLKQVFD